MGKEDLKEQTDKAAERRFALDQLDQMLALSQPKHWGIVATMLFLLSALIIWSFLGRIPTEVEGRAVALGAKGVFTILSKAPGTVTGVFVQENQNITEGTTIATIHNAQLKGLIITIQKAQMKIKSLESEMEILKKSFDSKSDLFDKGLLARTVLEEYKTRLIDKEINLSDAKASLGSNFSELERVSSSSREDFQLIEQKMKDNIDFSDIAALENELATVKSPHDGKILEILIKKGNIIELKTPLVWMEYPQDADKEAIVFYSYLPVEMGNKIKPGMSVQIIPSIVNVQEYGSIIGTVKAVSPFTLSGEELFSTLGNNQLVKYLTEDLSSVIQVIVEGKQDPSTPSGFAWTSGRGPPIKIPTGTISIVKVVVEEQPPISYLIPLWKLKPY